MPKNNKARLATSTTKEKNTYRSKWLNNAAKNMGFMVNSYLSSVTPNMYELGKESASAAASLAKNIRNSRSNVDRVVDSLKGNKYVKYSQEAYKNALDDLKNGRLNNDERYDKYLDKALGLDDLDASFDTSSDSNTEVSFGDEDGDTYDINVDNSKNAGATMSVAESINQASESNLKTSKANMDAFLAIGASLMNQVSESSSDILDKMDEMNNNLSALVDYQNDNISSFIKASMTFFESVGGKTEDNNSDIVIDDKITAAGALHANGGLDVNSYKKYVKQSFLRYIKNSNVGGTSSAFLPFLKDDNVINMFVQNPIGTAASMVSTMIVPKFITNTLEKIEGTYNNYMPAFLTKLSDLRNTQGKKPQDFIKRFIGEVFGLKTDRIQHFDSASIDTGPIPFDGETKHAITEIITNELSQQTGYLKIIASNYDKNAENTVYQNQKFWSYDTNEYISRKDLNSDLVDDLVSGVTSTLSSDSFLGERLEELSSKVFRDKDSKESEDVNNIIEEFLMTIEKAPGALRPEDLIHIIKNGNLGTAENKKLVANYVKDVFKNKDNKTDDYGHVLTEEDYINDLIRAQKSAQGYFNDVKDNYNKFQKLSNINHSIFANGVNIDYALAKYKKYNLNPDFYASGYSNKEDDSDKASLADIDDITPNGPDNGPGGSDIGPSGLGGRLPSFSIGSNDKSPRFSRGSNDESSSFIDRYKKFKDEDIDSEEGLTGIIGNAINSGIKAALTTNTGSVIDKISEQVSNGVVALNTHVQKLLFGETYDKEGHREGGIFTSISNSAQDMLHSVMHTLTGKGYTDRNGKQIADSKDSVLGKFKESGKFVVDGIKTRLFGEETGEYDTSGKAIRKKGIFGDFTDSIKVGIQGWSDTFFGTKTDKDRDPKERKKHVKEYLEKSKISGLTGAIAGGAVSMLSGGSLLGMLVGGPITGVALGAATGIASRSEKFQKFLFGEKDPDGKRTGGLISQHTQEFFKKHGKFLTGSAAIGGIKGALFGGGTLGMLVGGPVAGAITGLATGMVLKSTKFQEMVFGKTDEDGNIVKKGILKRIQDAWGSNFEGKDQKEKNANGRKVFSMGAIGAATGGILGAALGGPVIGSIAGLTLGIKAAGNGFHDWFFGTEFEDKEGKKHKKKGVIGKIGDTINLNIIQPIANEAKYILKDFSSVIRHKIVAPLGLVAEYGVKKIGGVVANIGKAIGGKFKTFGGIIKNAAKEAFSPITNAIGKTVSTAMDFMWKSTKRVLSAPEIILRTVANALDLKRRIKESKIVRKIDDIHTAVKGGIKLGLTKFFNGLFKLIAKPFNLLGAGIKGITSLVKIGAKKLSDGLKTLGDKFGKSRVGQILQGNKKNGERNVWGRLKDKVGDSFQKAVAQHKLRKYGTGNPDEDSFVQRLNRNQLEYKKEQKEIKAAREEGRNRNKLNKDIQKATGGEYAEYSEEALDYILHTKGNKKAASKLQKFAEKNNIKTTDEIKREREKAAKLKAREEATENKNSTVGKTKEQMLNQKPEDLETTEDVINQTTTSIENILSNMYDFFQGIFKDKRNKNNKNSTDSENDEASKNESALNKLKDKFSPNSKPQEVSKTIKNEDNGGGNGSRMVKLPVHKPQPYGGAGILSSIVGAAGSLLSGIFGGNKDDDSGRGGLFSGIKNFIGKKKTSDQVNAEDNVKKQDEKEKSNIQEESKDIDNSEDNAAKLGAEANAATNADERAKLLSQQSREINAASQEKSHLNMAEARSNAKTADERRAEMAARENKDEGGSSSGGGTAHDNNKNKKNNNILTSILKAVGTAGLLGLGSKIFSTLGNISNIVGTVSGAVKTIASFVGGTILKTIDAIGSGVKVLANHFSIANNGGRTNGHSAGQQVKKEARDIGNADIVTDKNGDITATTKGRAGVIKRAVRKQVTKKIRYKAAKLAENEGEKIVEKGAESASKGVLTNTEKLTEDAVKETSKKSGSKLLTKVKEMVSGFFTKIIAKLGEKGIKIGAKDVEKNVSSKGIMAAVTKVWGKIQPKLLAVLGWKTTIGTLTFGTTDLINIGIDALDGISGAAKLFHVPEKSVDGTMRLISAIFGAFSGTKTGTVMDIINGEISDIIGVDIYSAIATAVYTFIKGGSDSEAAKALDKAQKSEQKNYGKYKDKKLSKELKQQKKLGLVDKNVKLKDFKQGISSGKYGADYKSYQDYNADKHKSITDKITSAIAKPVVKPVVKTSKEIIGTLSGTEEVQYQDTKRGIIYKQDSDGNYYAYDKKGNLLSKDPVSKDALERNKSLKSKTKKTEGTLGQIGKGFSQIRNGKILKGVGNIALGSARSKLALGAAIPKVGLRAVKGINDLTGLSNTKFGKFANSAIGGAIDLLNGKNPKADIKSAMKDTDSKTTKTLLADKKSEWVYTDGTYYKSNGKSFDRYSSTGKVIAKDVSVINMESLIISGVVKNSNKKAKIKTAEDLGVNSDGVSSAFKDAATFIGKKITSFLNSGKDDDLVKKMDKKKTISELLDSKSDFSNRVFIDTTGNFYKCKGRKWTKYSPHGDVIETDIPNKEMVELIEKGALTETQSRSLDSITKSATSFVKSTEKAISTGITKLKNSASNMWNNVTNWLSNLGNNSSSSNTTTAASGPGSYTTMGAQGNGSGLLRTLQKHINNSSVASTVIGMAKDRNNGAKGNGPRFTNSTKLFGGRGPDELNGSTYYSQEDSRWKNNAYNMGQDNATMGDSGCGPTAMAMVASDMTGSNVKPTDMASLAESTGDRDETGTNWNFIGHAAGAMGMSSQQTLNPSAEEISNELDQGNPVVLSGVTGGYGNRKPSINHGAFGSAYTPAGHYVVAVGKDTQGNAVINDPRGPEYSGSYDINSLANETGSSWTFGGHGTNLNHGMYGGFGKKKNKNKSTNKNSKNTKSKNSKATTSNKSHAYPDTSHYHPVSDWNAIKDHFAFIITKATEGAKMTDNTLKSFIKNCESKNIAYWLYVFLKKGNELAQTKRLVDVCKKLVGKNFVGYCLDVESNNSASDVQQALDYLKTACKKQMIYTMYSQYNMYKKVINSRGSSCAWWEACYGKDDGTYSGSKASHKGVDLHQYTSKAKCPGFPSTEPLDMNVIVGSKDESWFSNGHTAKNPVTIDNVKSAASEPGGTSNGSSIVTSSTSSSSSSSGSSSSSVLEQLGSWMSGFTSEFTNRLITGDTSTDYSGLYGDLLGNNSSSSSSSDSSSSSSSTSSSDNGVGAANVKGSNVAKNAWDYFTSNGYSKAATAGIMGNLEAESGMNPKSHEVGGPGRGLAQWTYGQDRFAGLVKLAKSKGKDWTDLGSQLEFINKELHALGSAYWKSAKSMGNAGTTGTTFDAWKKSTNVETATRQFEGAFERAKAGSTMHIDRRIGSAKGYYKKYGGGGKGGFGLGGHGSVYTPAGHYVVAVGKDNNGNAIINDPRGEQYSGSYDINKLASETGSSWTFGGHGAKLKHGMYGGLGKKKNKNTSSGGNVDHNGVDRTRWLQIVRAVKKAIAAQKPGYSRSRHINITVGGKTLSVRTDCSGFVSACLRFYGVYQGETTSSGIVDGSLKNTGFKRKSWPGWDKLTDGDIMARDGHTEIFANNNGGPHVYNCGSTSSVNNPGVTGTGHRQGYTVVYEPCPAPSNAVDPGGDGTMGANNGTVSSSSDSSSSDSGNDGPISQLASYSSAFSKEFVSRLFSGNYSTDYSSLLSGAMANTTGNSTTSGSSNSGGNTNASGNTNSKLKDAKPGVAAKMWNMLTKKGYSNAAAAAIVGNAYQETRMDPNANDSSGFGIESWWWETDLKDFNKYMKSHGQPTVTKGSKKMPSLQAQVDYIDYSLKNQDATYWKPTAKAMRAAGVKNGGSYSKLKSMSNVDDATKLYEAAYQRGNKNINMNSRLKAAHAYYDQFTKGGSSKKDSKTSKGKKGSKKGAKGFGGFGTSILDDNNLVNVTNDNYSPSITPAEGGYGNNNSESGPSSSNNPYFNTATDSSTSTRKSSSNKRSNTPKINKNSNYNDSSYGKSANKAKNASKYIHVTEKSSTNKILLNAVEILADIAKNTKVSSDKLSELKKSASSLKNTSGNNTYGTNTTYNTSTRGRSTSSSNNTRVPASRRNNNTGTNKGGRGDYSQNAATFDKEGVARRIAKGD